MLPSRLCHAEIFRERHHRLSGIPFGQSRDEIRVRDAEMTFDPFIHPGQAKNLNRARAAGAIGVAIKPPVGKHISRRDFHATSKAGFYKGAGQDHARITFQMPVAGGRAASRKCLDPNLNRSVMLRAHATSLEGFVQSEKNCFAKEYLINPPWARQADYSGITAARELRRRLTRPYCRSSHVWEGMRSRC